MKKDKYDELGPVVSQYITDIASDVDSTIEQNMNDDDRDHRCDLKEARSLLTDHLVRMKADLELFIADLQILPVEDMKKKYVFD